METKIEEIWKDVVGYEGLYQVSNYGNVRGLPRFKKRNNQWGEYNQFYPGRPIKGITHPNGYIRVDLNRGTLPLVHRLVALAFLENDDPKKEINHIDGNPRNNRLSNLEWVTHSENIRHADRTGLRKMPRGIDHWLHGGKHFRALPVLDRITGVLFECRKDACLALNLKSNTEHYRMKKNKSRLVYA